MEIHSKQKSTNAVQIKVEKDVIEVGNGNDINNCAMTSQSKNEGNKSRADEGNVIHSKQNSTIAIQIKIERDVKEDGNDKKGRQEIKGGVS